jgi:hypothetical protein
MESSKNPYTEIIQKVLRPPNLKSLKPKYEKIEILVYEDASIPNEPTDTIEITDMYPIQTIGDLCTQIYYARDLDEKFHPQNLCLLKATNNPTRPFLHFQYLQTLNDEKLYLINPFTLFAANRQDPSFVEANGNAKNVKVVSLEDMLLESTLFQNDIIGDDEKVYTLHLFLYTDLFQQYSGQVPINAADWEGMFRVYYPEYDPRYQRGELSEEVQEFTPKRVSFFEEKLNIIQFLDELIRRKRAKYEIGVYGKSVQLGSFRNLRFSWPPVKSREHEPFRIESIFYETPVNETIPYIRFIPKANIPLTKIYVKDEDMVINKPALERPEILLQWAEERSLTPQEDLIIMKCLLRSGGAGMNPIYATFYIFEDGSARLFVQPNKDEKNLSRSIDLANLADLLLFITSSIPKLNPLPNQEENGETEPLTLFTADRMKMDEAHIILSLIMDNDSPPVYSATLYPLLRYFHPFFQVTTSAIKEQNPVLSLRYKGVDNFRTPSRDFQFLSRIGELQKIKGETNVHLLVKYYEEEFRVSKEVATARVSKFLQGELEYELVNDTELDYTRKENPGIDIAVFGRFPSFNFHMYRVDSIESLLTIKTLLSLLFTVEPEDFEDLSIQQSAIELEQEDVQEQVKANQKAVNEIKKGFTEDERDAITGKLEATASTSNMIVKDDDFDLTDLNEMFDMNDVGIIDSNETIEDLVKEDEDIPMIIENIPKPKKTSTTQKPTDLSLGEKEESRYFIKRLLQHDKKLFDYYIGKKGVKQYPRMCSAHESKQPAVMTESAYDIMRNRYRKNEENGDVLFIDYPLPKGESLPKPKREDTEIITTIRYGTDLRPGQANLYLCAHYWCIYDQIVILEKDFEDKNACPFCGGTKFDDFKDKQSGQTVYERKYKDKSDKRFTYVSFLAKSPHPDGYALPCCFTKNHLWDESDTPYKTYYDLKKKVALKEQSGEQQIQEQSKESPSTGTQKQIIQSYKKTINEKLTVYIVGSEKLPLELRKDGPQIGRTSNQMDKYFQQPSNLVLNEGTFWRIMKDNKTGKPSVSGFFRIGVDQSSKAESFLSAVAPYYGFNSTDELKRNMLQVLNANIFISLNYGNLLLEFYNPNYTNEEILTSRPSIYLQNFLREKLYTQKGYGINEEALLRAYKSYNNFLDLFELTNVYKEYRQLAPFFIQPYLLHATSRGEVRNNGILFIVLEVNEQGEVTIRCPPYGVSEHQTEICDIAFISYYPHLEVWEPLFYTENDIQKKQHESYFLFHRELEEEWPEIVKNRVKEYFTMCKSTGLGMYTDSPLIKSETLIPLRYAMEIVDDHPEIEVYAILRDIYNHVSAVVFRLNKDNKDDEEDDEDGELVVLHVIDDGTIYPNISIEFDWENFTYQVASLETVIQFYNTYVKGILTKLNNPLINNSYKQIQDGNRYVRYQRIRQSKVIKGKTFKLNLNTLQLQNGLFIPVYVSEEQEQKTPFTTIEEAPWMIDKQFMYGTLKSIETVFMDRKEIEESYQHLRFTFANWLSLIDGTFRDRIQSIIMSRDGRNKNNILPLFEKRKRLDILFGQIIRGWLNSDIPTTLQPTLKRVNCLAIKQKDKCSNRCVWRESDKKCLLHVPKDKQQNISELLVKRLIDELIRFPELRKEILSESVSKYLMITDGFRDKHQLIIPENVPMWSEILRMEWKKQIHEKPKFIEELTSVQIEQNENLSTKSEVQTVVKTNSLRKTEITKKSDELKQFTTTKSNSLHFIKAESGTVLELLGDLGLNLFEFLETFDLDFEEVPNLHDLEQMEYIAEQLQSSIIQVIFEEEKISDIEVVNTVIEKALMPYIIIVKKSDESVGILSMNPIDLVLIQKDNLPANVLQIAKQSKIITLV